MPLQPRRHGVPWESKDEIGQNIRQMREHQRRPHRPVAMFPQRAGITGRTYCAAPIGCGGLKSRSIVDLDVDRVFGLGELTMQLSLDGIRVLELARFQAGPRGGMILSDLGAEVIKVERIGGEETRSNPPIVRGQSVYFAVYNRGKKSICLDMRTVEGKGIFAELVRKTDIVLENFRPGTMAAMGFGYEALKALKHDIILVSVSGFGQYGPYRDFPAFDPLGQAMSGLMSLTGQPVGQPVGTAFSLVDRTTALHATIGALAALRHRDRTGEGQMIDCCLLDSALTMVEIPSIYYLDTGEEGGEGGRPPYRAKDGWVVISAVGYEMVEKLMRIIGPGRDPAGSSTEPMNSSVGRGDERRRLLESWCSERSVTDILQTLQSSGVPVAPVRNIPEVTRDAHMWQREMLAKQPDALAGEIHVPGLAVKMSATPGRIGPVPTPGQHTDEILTSLLNYDAERLQSLRSAKVIA
jgi:crotonobetainyl-CoA:carnitine CoA-transferase CaiB-like acyl-CoA transferase